jgi:alanine racemase
MFKPVSTQSIASSSRQPLVDAPSTSSADKGKSTQRPGMDTPSRTSSLHGGAPVRSSTAIGGLTSLIAGKKAATPLPTPAPKASLDVDAMLQETARTRAVLNMSAVRRNIRRGLALVGSDGVTRVPARGGAVLKADGYGLNGSNPAAIAKVLVSEGVRDMFVAELSEAVKLRAALKKERPDLADDVSINVLGGLDMDVNPKWLIDHDITPVLNSVAQVRKWNDIAAGLKAEGKLPPQGLDCILQFDSGMSRTGIGGDQVDALLAAIRNGELPHIAPQLMMSHLAEAGDADPATENPATKERSPGDKTLAQLARFDDIAARLKQHYPGIQESLGASSTVFLGKDLHKNMVRMGATFHAQAPFETDTNPLEPTLTVTSKLGPFQKYPPGAKVGYDGTYTVTRPGGEVLGTIPVGYRDLLPPGDRWNHQGDGGKLPTVRLRTPDGTLHPCTFAGKFSMDMCEINLSDIPEDQLKEGLDVVLIDDKVSTGQFAAQFGVGASYLQTKIASDRVAISHVETEPFPSPAAEPVVEASPWSKAGRAARSAPSVAAPV